MSLTRAMELQPIGSPDRPLRLQALKSARLPLQIQPEEAQQEAFILVLSGLPAKTSVSGAERMGSDSWLLPPDSIGKTRDHSARMVCVADGSGYRTAAHQRRDRGTVQRHGLRCRRRRCRRRRAKPDQTALKELAHRGDQLLGRGDVVAARALYERAAEMGSGPAALALGSTFDPNRLWSLGVFGMVGNKERARRWYMRADQLGHPEAKARLKALGN